MGLNGAGVDGQGGLCMGSAWGVLVVTFEPNVSMTVIYLNLDCNLSTLGLKAALFCFQWDDICSGGHFRSLQ